MVSPELPELPGIAGIARNCPELPDGFGEEEERLEVIKEAGSIQKPANPCIQTYGTSLQKALITTT